MIDFTRNNLNNASSPYLQQHKNNPIFWQEWSKEALEYAKKHKKMILVSIGYATCHWCHVMAREAFSNNDIAEFLNEHFVCIKVDKEQRPDIDQYFMAFLVEQQGHGGWPLNVICTKDAIPFIGLTYVPITPQYDMPGFLDILKYAISKSEQAKNVDSQKKFVIEQNNSLFPSSSALEEAELIESYKNTFNTSYGGFAQGPQFPPHNTLLFLLHYSQIVRNEKTKKEILAIIEKTLDVMANRGLHDHLQGGFFRYCIDSDWTIPHFEKMLYDQALLLWVYSSAYKIFKKQDYKIVADKIVQCLEETYKEDNKKDNQDNADFLLYYSAHDADTEHKEGATYIFSKKELEQILSPKEFSLFSTFYLICELGNFEGKNHLLKAGFSTGVFTSGFADCFRRQWKITRKLEDRPERTWMKSKSDNVDKVGIIVNLFTILRKHCFRDIFSEHTIRSLTGGGRSSVDIKKTEEIEIIKEIEKKILGIRKKRIQPFVDKKMITSWNAYAGIGLLIHWRATGNKESKKKSEKLYATLLKKHFIEEKLSHSSFKEQLQPQEFLEDYAAVLLFATYLYEENFSLALKKDVDLFSSLVLRFQNKDGIWKESNNNDFYEIFAQTYDHPTPSSLSLAIYALARAKFLLGKEEAFCSNLSIPFSYKPALAYDFFNLAVLFLKGNFHMIHSPTSLSWNMISLHSIQTYGEKAQDCYEGKCVELKI